MNTNSENLDWFFISTMENILKVKTNYYLNEKIIIQPMCAFDTDLPCIGQLSAFSDNFISDSMGHFAL